MPRRRTHLLVLLVAACGGDDGIPRPACPDQLNADFELAPVESDLLRATGLYWNAPGWAAPSGAVDGCASWSVFYDETRPETEPRDLLDVGVLTFTAGDFELTVSPTDRNDYLAVVEDPSLAAGEPVTLSAAAEDTGVRPFELTARAVPDLTVPASTLTTSAGEDLEVRWDLADSPPGTRIEFAAQVDDLGYSEFLSCWSDDTGSMTIPAGDLDPVRSAGVDPLQVSLERVHSATAETEHGCALFEIRSKVQMDLEFE